MVSFSADAWSRLSAKYIFSPTTRLRCGLPNPRRSCFPVARNRVSARIAPQVSVSTAHVCPIRRRRRTEVPRNRYAPTAAARANSASSRARRLTPAAANGNAAIASSLPHISRMRLIGTEPSPTTSIPNALSEPSAPALRKSPHTLSCGPELRSTSVTDWPAHPSTIAAAEPAGPPPMISGCTGAPRKAEMETVEGPRHCLGPPPPPEAYASRAR